MNNEALEHILSELLVEVKDLNKNQKFHKTTLESFADNIGNFENLLKQVKIEVPKPDNSKIESLISNHFQRINQIVREQPKEVLHEKRVLFYPEGNGENFLKLIAKRLIISSAIVVVIYFLLSFWFDSIKENVKYKRVYNYIYYTNNEKGKSYLDRIKGDFENDSIRSIRMEELKLKKQDFKKSQK